MDEATATKAIENYVYGYSQLGGYKKFAIYEGIEDLVKRLNGKGVKVSIVSAKPLPQLNKVVEFSGLMPYLDKVVGPNGEGKKDSDKSELIKIAKNGSNCVMVGDSTYDIQSAKKAGVKSVAVTYGFGFSKNDDTGADYTVDTVEKLRRILLEEI
jgi:phosphoglycolate phosphatase